jgi:hypothetical protein
MSNPPEIPEELRPYVEELRQEAAGYRKKYAPFRDAFDGYRDDEMQFLLELVTALRADDTAPAAKVMRDIAFDLLGERWTEDAPWTEAEAEEEVPDEEEEEEVSEQLTAEEIQRILDERDAKRKEEENESEIARMVDEIRKEAEALGYTADSPDYYLLIQTGMHKTEGDLTAAAKLIAPVTGITPPGEEAEPEAAEPEPEAEAAAPRFPKPLSGGAGAPPAEANGGPKNLNEARDAVHDWLATRTDAPVS